MSMNSDSSNEPVDNAPRGAGKRPEARELQGMSESALHESEQWYRTLFNTMSEGFALHEIICDEQGRPCDFRFLEINPAFERQTGLRAGDLLGKTVRKVLPGIEPIWIERYGRVALTGQAEQFEAWSEPLRRWYDVRAYQTAPGRFAAVFADITERKQSEEAVHNAALFPEENPSPVLRVARDGALLYANASSASLRESWGCQPGQVVPEEVRRYVADALNADATAEMEVVHGAILYSFFIAPIGAEGYANLYGREVTERRRAENALHEAHQRLQMQAEELQTANEELHAQAEELQVSNEELREHELALRESEQRLMWSQEIAHLGSWELDLAHNRLTWSDEVYRIFGLTPREFGATYEAFLARVHPDDRAAVDTAYSHSLRENRDAYEIEHRVVRPATGEIRFVHEKCRHFRGASGRVVRSIGMVHDITERKHMEAQLRRLNDQLEEEVQVQTEELKDTVDRLQDEVARRVLAEGRLRKRSQMLEVFFQHTITPLAFLDRNFNFVRVNEAYAKADQREPEHFIGKNHFVLYPHEENRRIFEQVVRTKQPYFAHAKPFTYPDAPQRVTYWDWQLTPLLDERGDVQFLVLNLKDVTERQTAFQELEHRARQLQKLALELSQAEDRERKRLAEILHDDLQQQLAAARFHLSLLGNRVPKDSATRDTASRLDQILKDAIETSRSLSHELSPAVLYQSDLGETFEWLARQLQAKHGLTVHVETRDRIESASEPLKVFLYKTAREILFNVVKHAQVREARLRLQRLREHVWLTISDQGRGFDPRSLGKAGGFGLLGIRERIELLGGRMKIRSAPGRGSTFLITVPDAPQGGLAMVDGGFASRGPIQNPPSAIHPPPSERDHRLRVLLVDDHEVTREGLAALLHEQADLEVVGQAGNGREAVHLACRLRPDVVVMDVAMPVMAGDEAARQIKLRLPHARVVALSMFEEAGTAQAMREAGAEAYLLKTAPAEDLLAAIRGRPPQAPGLPEA